MKRFVSIFLATILAGSLCSCSLQSIFQSKPKENTAETDAASLESITMHPIKDVSFALKVGSPIIYVDNSPVEFDVPVREIDGRTMVPLSFFKDYCQMKDMYYDPENETISFSMPVQEDILEKATPVMSMENPGFPNEVYDIAFTDSFTGDTIVSIKISDIIQGEEAYHLVAEKDPLAIPPSDTNFYTICTITTKLVSIENTDNFPLQKDMFNFYAGNEEQIGFENITILSEAPLEGILNSEQEYVTQLCIVSPTTDPPIIAFMDATENPIFIKITP